jgi:hypothetical protein
LTRGDDPAGLGGHRTIPLSAIAEVEAGRVRLILPSQQARAMAAGGGRPDRMEEDYRGTGDAAATNPPGVGDSAAAPANGPGSGNIHGGGTTAGRTGLGGGKARGGGTGGGPGFRGDPNMDPDGRGEV